MRELVKTMERHRGTDFKWIAVRTSENQGRQLMGFSTGLNDSSDGEIIDEEKYPGFHLVDTMKLIPTKPKEEVMSQRYTMHFTSMLKYLTDRKEAVAALNGINATIEYEDALKYIEENGVCTYGALVYGEADDLLKLYESGDIMTFYIDNVVSSKYMNRILYY